MNDEIKMLVNQQKLRKFAIVAQSRSDRSTEALIAGEMGFSIDLDEPARKKVYTAAKVYRVAVEKGTNDGGKYPHLVYPILINKSSRAAWDELRMKQESAMEEIAKTLPCAKFVETVRGLGPLGYAVLQAEAGRPFTDYGTVSKLWKRMGVAVIDGERQQRRTNAEEAKLHGYSPKRRAQLYAFVSDTMLRGQWRGARVECPVCAAGKAFTRKEAGIVCSACKTVIATETAVIAPGYALGPYGEIYARRKAWTLPRIEDTKDIAMTDKEKWTGLRCENDARRIMSKALLRDLWRVSRGLPPRGSDAPPEFVLNTELQEV